MAALGMFTSVSLGFSKEVWARKRDQVVTGLQMATTVMKRLECLGERWLGEQRVSMQKRLTCQSSLWKQSPLTLISLSPLSLSW